MIIQKKAHAKINLYLKILNKRPDGYHDIFTVMQKISLCDDITIDINPGAGQNIKIACNDKNIPTDRTNTVYKAIELFFSRANIRADFDINIEIDKKIPAQSGLGGGSSDAASVLLGLNEYYDFILSEKDLIGIAAKVGADVPFFVKNTSCAICEGIGEIVTPVALKSIKSINLSRLHVVILKPVFNVSTKQAFEDFDKYIAKYNHNFDNLDNFDTVDKNIISEIINCGNVTDIFNDFFALACLQDKNAKEYSNYFTGVLAHGLSGSGSALFGVFTCPEKAQKCKNEINQRNDIEFCDIFDFMC